MNPSVSKDPVQCRKHLEPFPLRGKAKTYVFGTTLKLNSLYLSDMKKIKNKYKRKSRFN